MIKNTPLTKHQSWRYITMLLLILLVAAGLRLYRLPELPLGLHYDEAANGILADEIARGVETPVFIPSYTGKEVLFFYWAALWMKLLGATPLALRLSAAWIGIATVAASVWAVRELLHGRRDAQWIALLTAAFLATSFWHLVLSRYGFRAVTQPLMQSLTVAALWRGLHLSEKKSKRGLLWLVLAGLCCGLTAYTYLAARAFPIPLAAAALTILIADRGRRRARLGQLALFVAVAALTLAPLAHYWLIHPGSFMTRANQVAAASWSEAWAGIRACLGMFFLRGDPYIRFNIPHHPLFGPITAALFLLGIVIVIWRPVLRSAKPSDVPSSPRPLASRIFLLTYLPAMLLPSALTVGDITPSNLRAVGLLPFVYVFPALGIQAVLDAAHSLPAPFRTRLLPASCVLLLVLSGVATASAYFNHWAASAALYYAADGDLADVAAYLNQADLTAATPYVASIHYRHPTLAFLAEEYGAIRWLTGGKTFVFQTERETLLILPHSASRDLAWIQSALSDDALVSTTAPPGPDGAPAFHAYRIRPTPDLTPTHSLTANLAHAVGLLGYDVVGQPRSNESAEVAVWWRVLNAPPAGDYAPLARLTDPWGFVWGETRPFHYPSEQWTPGEWVVDHLSIPVHAGAPPGDYVVRLSFYSAGADSRLPVLDDDGRYAGADVQLPVHLASAAALPELQDLSIRNRLDADVDGLTWLGFNLDTDEARPGERLYLTLFWQAGTSPLPDIPVTLTLGGATLYTGAPVHDTYPTSDWTAGEIVTDRYNPRLPRDMSPGDHALRLHVNDHVLNLDIVTVQALDRVFDVPPISHPLAAALGGQVRLLGYDISADAVTPGQTLILTLYWQALAEMDEDYTVFTHLLAPDGSTTGQRDSHPVGGAYPTSLWLSGEIVADVHEIPIRPDAAPGAHWLEVGMYVAETGRRLATGAPDDALVLQTITLP
jgi:hypothetical protein